jgi:hypothetical protein
MRIGDNYSYLLVVHQIVDTPKIVSFRSEEKHVSRGSTFHIYAVIEDSEASLDKRELYVTATRKAKQADTMIHQATYVLKCMQGE